MWMFTPKKDKSSLRNRCTRLTMLPGRAVKLQQFNQCDYAGQGRDMRKRDQHTHSRRSVNQGKQEVGQRGFRSEAPLSICHSFIDSLTRWLQTHCVPVYFYVIVERLY